MRFLGLITALILVTCALAGPAPAAAVVTTQDVVVRAGEQDSVYYYSPDLLRVPAGFVRVTFVNEGARQHTFNVKRADEWRDLYNFPLVQAGESNVFEFELWEPGDYVFYCQLYKHVDHGQTGIIRVSPS
jgi:plastocyanin